MNGPLLNRVYNSLCCFSTIFLYIPFLHLHHSCLFWFLELWWYIFMVFSFFFSTFFSKTTNIFSDGIITKATQGGDQFVSIDGKRTYFAVAPTHMPTFQHTRPCKLDILFPSNHNIHKSSWGLYFWLSHPLIDRF